MLLCDQTIQTQWSRNLNESNVQSINNDVTNSEPAGTINKKLCVYSTFFKSSWFHLLLDCLDPFPSARDIHFSFWVVFHLWTCKLILASFNAETLKKSCSTPPMYLQAHSCYFDNIPTCFIQQRKSTCYLQLYQQRKSTLELARACDSVNYIILNWMDP